MRIFIHKNFEKKYKKLKEGEKKKFKERRNVFLSDPLHPLLHNHALAGKYKWCRSINITGNVRFIYEQVDNKSVPFI